MSHTTSAHGARQYQRMAVEAASPVGLVVMLYDGALKYAAQGREAILRRDLAMKGQAISRVLAIVGELQGSLDMDRGGDIAVALDAQYDYVTDRLLAASKTLDVKQLDEAVTVLTTLREGWVGVAAHEAKAG